MSSAALSRRRWLQIAAGSGLVGAGLATMPEVRLFAQQLQDFIEGPPVPDVKPERIAPHVWMIYAQDGFPTPENRGVMANVVFVVTSVG
ncbi:MAG: MBL fold metallo-hydrolase, partial [Tepidimonas sp.]